MIIWINLNSWPVGNTAGKMWTGFQTLVCQYCSRSGRASGGRWSGQGHREQSGSILGGRKPEIAPVCFLQIRNFLKAHWEPRAGFEPSLENVAPGELELRLWRGSCLQAFILRWNKTAPKFGISEIDHLEENSTNLNASVAERHASTTANDNLSCRVLAKIDYWYLKIMQNIWKLFSPPRLQDVLLYITWS